MNREEILNELIKGCDTNKISDGYHTFEELYEHRIVLYIALALSTSVSETHSMRSQVWKSTAHSDGSIWDGWFMLGIGKKAGEQITYHLPMKYWEQCDFAETLAKAPTFDGHSSQDVLKRIANL